MPRYEVIAPGFFEGVLCEPGHPRKGFVNVDAPLKPVPSWLKPAGGETPAQKGARTKAANAAAVKAKADAQDIENATFMGGGEAATVETL